MDVAVPGILRRGTEIQPWKAHGTLGKLLRQKRRDVGIILLDDEELVDINPHDPTGWIRTQLAYMSAHTLNIRSCFVPMIECHGSSFRILSSDIEEGITVTDDDGNGDAVVEWEEITAESLVELEIGRDSIY